MSQPAEKPAHRLLVEKKFWVEVVTLLVPGFNDTDEELRDLTAFLSSVSPDIPWHVTAFHSDYKMADTENTPVPSLLRAVAIGKEAGLRFVYAGNIPGSVSGYENTLCPSCGQLLIERWGFTVRKNLLRDGCCPKCSTKIPGVWK